MEPAVVAEAASLDALTASSLALHVRRRRRSKDTNEATGLGELLSYRTVSRSSDGSAASLPHLNSTQPSSPTASSDLLSSQPASLRQSGVPAWNRLQLSTEQRLSASLAVNVAFMLVEFAYGWVNGSLGMLSDAAHMLLDNAAIAIGLAAAHIAAKQTTAEGRLYADRVQVLAGFANAVVLVFVALNICLEATVHLMEGGHDVTTHRLLPVSVAGLAVNLLGLVFAHKAHQHGAAPAATLLRSVCFGQGCDCRGGADANMRAIFLHILADTLGSCAVLASTLAVQLLHWHWADPVASVAIAVMIVVSVLPLLRQAAAVLLLQPERTQRAAFDGCLARVRCMDGVTAIASTSFIQVSGSEAVGCVRVCVASDADKPLLLRQVRSVMERGRLHELFVELLDS